MTTNSRGRRLPVTLTQAEAEALVARVNPRSTTGLRNRALLAVMLGAGLRVSEVAALKPADLDLARGTVRVNLGKSGKDRIIPVDGETRGWLQAWAEKRTALGLSGRQPFFTRLKGGTGTGLSVRAIQDWLARLGESAGLDKRISPHVLRHTYATRMLDQGLTLRDVQELLGHAHVATTEIYTHVSDEALRAKIQAPRADLAAKIDALEKQLAELRAQL